MRPRCIMPAMAAGLAILLGAGSAAAHHSFAVFFVPDRMITVKGVVQDFQFSNPHGVVTLTVDKDGKAETWRAETNAPVILRRYGWSPGILKAGDEVTLEGWPARDGSNYMRLRRAVRADGTPVGQPLGGAGNQQ